MNMGGSYTDKRKSEGKRRKTDMHLTMYIMRF